LVKRILVPLDPSPYTQTAIKIAARIAKKTDAELTGLVILDIEGIEDSIGPVPMGGLYYAEKMEMAKKVEASQRVEELLRGFKKKCEEYKVRHDEAHLQGCPSTKIVEEARYYDIVVLGLRTHFQFEVSDNSESLENILKESVTPILGIPKSFELLEDQNTKTRAVLAFDGSLLAARAMQRFAQLIKPDTFELTIVNSGPDKEQGYNLINKAKEYLKIHGLKNVESFYTSHDINATIRDQFFDKTDVFVVGAHAKDSIFDFMVGSLTKYLLNQDEKAVFIGQ
jgi:nucleotide-binding universal stress UspA family protein